MKILLEHLQKNREVLMKYSELIGGAQHKGNLGTAREALISAFLRLNLPEFIAYHTGEIFDSSNKQSGQIDIILHPITSPKLNLYNAVNLFPSETVLCALEVKSELSTGKTGELFKALKSCARVKQLVKRIPGEPGGQQLFDLKYVPFIVFAYSGRSKQATIKSISDFYSTAKINKKNLSILPDLIVVLSYGQKKESYFLKRKSNWWAAGSDPKNVYDESKPEEEVLLGLFSMLIKLIEIWFTNPQYNYMPIERYTKEFVSLDRFFKKD